MTDSVPRLLTLTELAERLRVSQHTIRAWVRRGRVSPVRVCRRLLFHPDEVARFLKVATAPPSEFSSIEDKTNSTQRPEVKR